MWRKNCYVRAITDQGQEMTRPNALTAAWPILSGATERTRGRQAMETALRELERDYLVQLFALPTPKWMPSIPAASADYPPGVRENGGQYSHGVSWLVDALLVLADWAREAGDEGQAASYRLRAKDLWLRFHPSRMPLPTPWRFTGSPPHQQAADIYYGQGYERRGGWSWYTGAAARMLYAANQLFAGTRTSLQVDSKRCCLNGEFDGDGGVEVQQKWRVKNADLNVVKRRGRDHGLQVSIWSCTRQLFPLVWETRWGIRFLGMKKGLRISA